MTIPTSAGDRVGPMDDQSAQFIADCDRVELIELRAALDARGYPMSAEAWRNTGDDAPVNQQASREVRRLHRAAVVLGAMLDAAPVDRNAPATSGNELPETGTLLPDRGNGEGTEGRALTLHASLGEHGLWYVTSSGSGLLVAEPSFEAALAAVPGALADLATASGTEAGTAETQGGSVADEGPTRRGMPDPLDRGQADDLGALSAAATPGMWRFSPSPGLNEAAIDATVNGFSAELANFYCCDGPDSDPTALPANANAALAVRLVNDYRSGRLVPAQTPPSGSVTIPQALVQEAIDGLAALTGEATGQTQERLRAALGSAQTPPSGEARRAAIAAELERGRCSTCGRPCDWPSNCTPADCARRDCCWRDRTRAEQIDAILAEIERLDRASPPSPVTATGEAQS